MEPRWTQLRRLAKARFDITRLRPGQRDLIDAVLDGVDALGIAQWGHDLRPSYLALADVRRQLGNPAVLALRHAESVECRVTWMRRYFADEPDEACQRCDNCTQPRYEVQRPLRRPRKPRTPPRRFEVGARVRHGKFGAGNVVELAEHAVVVEFADGSQRRIANQYLAVEVSQAAA